MKNNVLRVCIFLTLVFVGFSGPVWLFVVGAIGYVFLYLGLELLILAAAIDAYFGYASEGLFIYTAVTAIGLLLIQGLKPYLSVYNQ